MTEVLAQAVRPYESLEFEHLDALLANDYEHHAMTIGMMEDLKKECLAV
ncbi:hypothetical protein [Streptococcus halotolerans]|nr:hypothetical protein [Streptococcus halotolerans]